MDLALVGNCSYQGLIDTTGTVQWLCWPRFDSSFVFGALLDKEKGGAFSLRPAEDTFDAEQSYVPNTNILRTRFQSASGSFELTDFAPRFRQFDRWFKPNMLIRRIRRLSGDPRVLARVQPSHDYGRIQPEGYSASNHIQWRLGNSTMRVTTNVPLTYVAEGRPFLLEQDTYFVATWGEHLEASLVETCETFLARTKDYWERWVKHTALPGVLQREVIRSALALKLHQYEDTGAITAAATMSLPEHDGAGRNWDYRYCWLRDAYFTLRAMRRLGHFEEMEAFVMFLKNLAAFHELQPVFGITGEHRLTETTLDHLDGYLGNKPVRAGNAAYLQPQHDAFGEMIAAIAPLFLDMRFESGEAESGLRLVRKLLDGIERTMEEPDASIWEYRGHARVHAFSLLMHWTGAEVAARIGNRQGDTTLLAKAVRLARRARELLEKGCFVAADGFYGDAVGEANADASLFMMINLGFLKPDDPNARTHLRRLADRLRAKDHLLHRYVHHDGIGDTQNTFTVCGFWYAEALARLGDKDAALENCTSLMKHANHVGLLSEDIDPKTGTQWGNFPQTYSHVGLINAAFAINPVQTELGDI